MPEEKVKFKEVDGIGYITINNPQKMNILDFDVYRGLFSAFKLVEEDDRIGVVILTGEGDKAFVCGQDINTFKVSDLKEAKRFLRFCLKMFTELESLSKPVIAAVNGLALGGGTEMLLACDIVIASEKARFGLPESGIGVAPIWGIIRLANVVGSHKAKELMMTGDVITAEEAMRIGLVNKVVPHERLMGVAEDTARKILSKAPLAIELIKSSINRGLLPEGTSFTLNANKLFFQTEDMKEGINAFLKKRKPTFRGI
ncbi:MAG: enoyl-CoA hydratase/isomerase family protein [Thermodesulfobacteriota bacterium]